MHPYEMAATLKQRRKEQSIKLRYGSLYTVIDQLEREGLIEPVGTERDGGRPERTTYRITDPGEREMGAWLRALLSEPVKEYPQFEAALSLLPALPPKDVQLLLAERAYVKRLVRGIETGELGGIEQWQQWHLDHKRH